MLRQGKPIRRMVFARENCYSERADQITVSPWGMGMEVVNSPTVNPVGCKSHLSIEQMRYRLRE